ncbi:unnamed protein product [Durusdinium trenchii]|uniref:Secreted protein n=1 Tax=Durusdinium trenchii TaxID=1381693 RepID=A0ABP0P5C9_9DINO
MRRRRWALTFPLLPLGACWLGTRWPTIATAREAREARGLGGAHVRRAGPRASSVDASSPVETVGRWFNQTWEFFDVTCSQWKRTKGRATCGEFTGWYEFDMRS